MGLEPTTLSLEADALPTELRPPAAWVNRITAKPTRPVSPFGTPSTARLPRHPQPSRGAGRRASRPRTPLVHQVPVDTSKVIVALEWPATAWRADVRPLLDQCQHREVAEVMPPEAWEASLVPSGSKPRRTEVARIGRRPALSSEKRVSFGEFETKVNVPCIRCSTLNPRYSVVTSSIDVSSTVT